MLAGAEMTVLLPTVLNGAETTVPVSARIAAGAGWGDGVGPTGVGTTGGTGSVTGLLTGTSSASLASHGLNAGSCSRLAHALSVSGAGAESVAGLLRLLTWGGLLRV